jgi:hypothetical protein
MPIRQTALSDLAEIDIDAVVHTSLNNLFEGLARSHTIVTLPLVVLKMLDLSKGLMYVCNRYR